MKRMLAKPDDVVEVVVKCVEEMPKSDTVGIAPEVHVTVVNEIVVQICIFRWCWNVWKKVLKTIQ